MGMEEELNLMNKSFNEGLQSTEAPNTNAPSTNVPSTEAPGTEPPSTDAPVTETPTTEVPAEDERDAEIAELRRKLAEKEKPTTSAPTTSAPPIFDEQDFLGDIDIEDITSDSKELNKLLNKVYQKAFSDARKSTSESVLRNIPDIVRQNITKISELQDVSENFYKDNADLKPFNKVVAAVFEDIASKNPGKTYKEILPEVEKETRERLNLKKKASQSGNSSPPRLPRKKGPSVRTTEKPNLSPLESEIEEMNKTIGR